MDLDKLKTTKFVARFVVGSGASGIVKGIIANNTAPTTNRYQTVTQWAGSVVMGMMAADASKDYTEKKIDSYVDAWNKAKEKANEN